MSSNSLAPIKNWKPKHTMVVQLHVAAASNEEIARELGYSKVRVSQILNDPRSKQIIRAVNERLKKQMKDDVSTDLVKMAEQAKERVKETLAQEFVPGTDPKHHQDRVSMDVLKGMGFFPGSLKEGDSNEPKLTKSLADRLLNALEATNEMERAQKEIEQIEDADFELMEKQA